MHFTSVAFAGSLSSNFASTSYQEVVHLPFQPLHNLPTYNAKGTQCITTQQKPKTHFSSSPAYSNFNVSHCHGPTFLTVYKNNFPAASFGLRISGIKNLGRKGCQKALSGKLRISPCQHISQAATHEGSTIENERKSNQS